MNQRHFSLVCKHEHMLKNGAPPDKFGVRFCTYVINSMVYQTTDLNSRFDPPFGL